MTSNKAPSKSYILLQLPGHLLVCSLITAVISGLLIAFYYVPTPQGSALSITRIQEEIFVGSLIVTIHRLSWMSALFFTVCNLIIIIVSGKNSRVWRTIWYSGVILMMILFGFSITGFLLLGNDSALNTIKLISTRFFGSTAQSASLPLLFDSIPKIFTGIFMVHILVLPGIAGLVIYHHVKALKEFAADLHPFPLSPGMTLFILTTVLIFISLFVKPLEAPVTAYGENWTASVPWVVQFFIGLQRVLSLPGAAISICAGVILLLSVGFFTKRQKL